MSNPGHNDPSAKLRGIFVWERGERVRLSGKMKKTRNAVAGREALSKALAGRSGISVEATADEANSARVTAMSPFFWPM